jgi:hypothetical protein
LPCLLGREGQERGHKWLAPRHAGREGLWAIGDAEITYVLCNSTHTRRDGRGGGDQARHGGLACPGPMPRSSWDKWHAPDLYVPLPVSHLIGCGICRWSWAWP